MVQKLLDGFQAGKVFILPTDTVYALVASLNEPRAINEIYRIKGLKEGVPLSLLCRDVGMASYYAQSIPNAAFRFIKSHTPGPYTFILRANRHVDRRGVGKKKEVGVRFVDHPLHRALMAELEIPLASTSIAIPDDFATDAEGLDRIYGSRVAAVVDGGVRTHEYSTVIDCTESNIRLVRRGIGDASDLENLIALDSGEE